MRKLGSVTFMLRVYWPKESLNQLPNQIELSREESHHLVSVRRAVVGTEIEVFTGEGDRGNSVLSEANPKRAILSVKEWKVAPRLTPQIEFFPAVTKSSTLELLLQKATELGVARIRPLVMDHSEGVKGVEKIQKKMLRWDQLLIEAIKQSGNPYKPILEEPTSLQELVKEDSGATQIVLALKDEAQPWLKLQEQLLKAQPEVIRIFLGPEGDFSAGEYELLRERGCAFLSLGPTVLRMETAGIAGISLLHSLRS